MNSFTQLVNAIKTANWADANKTFGQVMQQKVADRLAVEKSRIFKEAKNDDYEDDKCDVCKGPNAHIQPNGDYLCRNCEGEFGRGKAPQKNVREDNRRGGLFQCLRGKCRTKFRSTEDEPTCPKCGAPYEDVGEI